MTCEYARRSAIRATLKSGVPDPEKVVSEVTDVLRGRRVELGLSHETVAKRAGVHRSTVSRIESKKITGSLFVFQSIANALDISLAEIIAEIESNGKT